jgi:hypothetical protein
MNWDTYFKFMLIAFLILILVDSINILKLDHRIKTLEAEIKK